MPDVYWRALSRLGESQILVPAFLAALAWLLLVASRPGAADGPGDASAARAAAGRWALGVGAAGTLTLASKVAFIGFGLGWAAIDFTGFSGHTLAATSILPVLAGLAGGPPGAACGYAVALVVMVSRVVIHAHSWSEVLGGALLGSTVAAATLGRLFAAGQPVRTPWWLPLLLAAWLTLLPWRAPPSPTHGLVVRLSLWVSGRPFPYTREQMLRDARPMTGAAATGAGPVPPAGASL